MVFNRGSGGHKGIESIINNLGTNNFIRIKIGICPEMGKPSGVESFVIKKFNIGIIVNAPGWRGL